MSQCPVCRRDPGGSATECPWCGIVFAKFRPDRPKLPPPAHQAKMAVLRGKPPAPPVARIALILVLGIGGGLAVVAGYWFFRIQPRVQALGGAAATPSREKGLEAREGMLTGADLSLKLPSEPIGLAWDGRSFVACNRTDPWGFLRVRQDGSGWKVRSVPVIEARYNQKIGLDSVTWNGENFIGYTTEGWFVDGSTGYVFTVHDPETLQVVRWVKAPESLGGIAWDGAGYWAATRNNTEDSGQAPVLYRLRPDFSVEATYQPPNLGTQGLAWDGKHLWAADVFADALYEMDVSGGTPSIMATIPIPGNYLGGVAWDSGRIWIAEYDQGAIHRLTPALLGQVAPEPGGTPEAVPLPASAGGEDPRKIAELRESLWSDDDFARMRAEFDLKQMGIPVNRDRETESSPDLGPEDTDLLDFRGEIVNGTLTASWKAHVGKDLFGSGKPQEGMVTVTPLAKIQVSVRGGTLGSGIEKEFDAVPGENAKDGVVLASGLGPGEYTVSFFIWVQYTDRTGQGRILNNSAGTLWLQM